MEKHLVISGVSSMQAWDEGAAAYAQASRLRAPSTFATSATDLASFQLLPQGCTPPVDILVGSPTRRHNSSTWHAHLRQSPLPRGAAFDIGSNRYLTSPAFFFLQTAPKLSFVQAVLLGLELCGYYSTLMSAPYRDHCSETRRKQGGKLLANPWPPDNWDISLEHGRNLMDNGFVNRAPLTSAAQLHTFLRDALSGKSNSRAITASRYVRDNSHSPMESRLYVRYCLPRRYGGLNLNPVELNREFDLSPELARATGISRYSVDLFWPKASTAIEYQGGHAHSSLSAAQKDRLKRNVLETTGVRIISIDRNQYANEDMLEVYSHEIAKKMGIEAWDMKPRAGEQAKRLALIDELNTWDCDLYRPGPKAGRARRPRGIR